MIIFKLIGESFLFALGALRANLLRTILSLLGVTIGILLIISVFTIVDSMERGINSSLSFLNPNNMDIRRFPYDFSPNMPWWEYTKRPYTTWEEYEFLSENVDNAEGITIFAVKGGELVKHKNSSSTGITMFGVSHSYKDVYEIPIAEGRYFTFEEAGAGRNVALIGQRLIKELFPNTNPLGKEIKIKGQRFRVVGTLTEEGQSFLGGNSRDDSIFIPFRSIKKMYYSGRRRGLETLISLQGRESDEGLLELEAPTH